MNKFWCFLRIHSWGKTEEDGFQYCSLCGKKIHQHKWELTRTTNVFGWGSTKLPEYIKYQYTCTICGDVKEVK